MSQSSNSEIVRRLYDEALNAARYEQVVDELASPDVIVHEPDGDQIGPEAIKRTMRALHQGFGGLHFDVQDLIESGDRVVVRWTMHAVHTANFAGFAPTGSNVEQHATVIYRLGDGRVAEVWPQIDRFGMMRQLGGKSKPA